MTDNCANCGALIRSVNFSDEGEKWFHSATGRTHCELASVAEPSRPTTPPEGTAEACERPCPKPYGTAHCRCNLPTEHRGPHHCHCGTNWESYIAPTPSPEPTERNEG